MKRYPIAAFLCCLFVIQVFRAFGQSSVPCPTNIDFELGNFTNWKLFTGTCCAINTPTSGIVAGRHTITSGTANDPYGGFPIVSPGGNYSLKLGNNSTGAQAERAKYFVHVPAGINDYSLVFRYAVVFQDPSHAAADQPRFEVKAYDSITNAIINCSQYTYVATSNIPGFTLSGLGSNVWYKPWTTTSIDLSGYAGRTVVIDFASGDCALGAHFGYGYIDLDCGLFKINTTACNSNPFTTLTAPPGFQSYIWKDSSLTTTVGTGQTVSIATPSATTKYAVILIPYTGYGCPDTLFTTVTVSNINVNARDTSICIGTSAQLFANATGTGTPYTYTWTPSTGLSCTNCANPITNTTINRTYYVSVTNSDNCTRLDTLNVRVSNIALSLSKQQVSCFGSADGNLSINAAGGIPSYNYLWNTTPPQTTSSVNNIGAGIYTVTVTDSIGCIKAITDTIKQPTLLTITKGAITNVSCYGGNNGTATITASGGTPPYSYNWSNSANTAAITSLAAGTYVVTVTDNKGCSATDSVVITQPTKLNNISSATNVSCYGSNNGTAITTASGGSSPYTYSWNTSPVKTTASINNLYAGTYIVTVTDNKGCTNKDTVIVNQPQALNVTDTQTNILCNGYNTGSATVNVSGGTMPYSYTWNTNPVQNTQTISSLVAGTYIATITDNNGCSIKDTIIISQPVHLSSSIVKTDALCYNALNGTATASTAGGTPPYSYSWNTNPIQTTATASSLRSGTYIVIITDSNNCTIQDTISILQPTQLAATMSHTNVSCNTGNNATATINASGGTPAYTYSWSTNPIQTSQTATGLTAGTYTILTTDFNGCMRTDTVIITEPPALTTTVSGTNISCYGGNNGTATVITGGGTTPYSYNWNTTPIQITATATGLPSGQYVVLVTDNNGCIKNDTVTLSQPSPITISHTTGAVNCYGGSNGTATVIVNGGTQPYTYLWSTNPAQTSSTVTNLTSGVYSVTVTDSKGCIKYDSVSITQPTLLTTAKSKTDVSCYNGTNGTATIIASGGTLPYSYSWNTFPTQTNATATGLTANTYIALTIDSKGCAVTDTFTITQPAPLTSGKSKTDVSCFNGNNGTATTVVSGGTPPYTYNWNTSPIQTTATATTLNAGIYIVTITDNHNCIKYDTISIGQPTLLVATTTKKDLKCFDDSTGIVTANASGGTPPYTYTWNTVPIQTTSSISSLQAGIYNLIITDNKGCITAVSTTVTQPNPLSSTISGTDINCFGGNDGSVNINVTGGTQPYSYQWNNAANTANNTKLIAGKYNVTVTDHNGCILKDSAELTEPTVLSLQSQEDGKTCVGFATGTASALAKGGTPPYSYSWNTTPAQIGTTASNLFGGAYIVTAVDANGCTQDDTVDVSNFPKPDISAGPDKAICFGEKITLTATGAKSYNWTPSSTVACSNCPSTVVYPGNTTTYTVIGIDSNKCEDTALVTVFVTPKKEVSVGPPIDICIGEEVTLSASGGERYQWFPANALDNPYSSNPKVVTDTDAVFTVVITENECFVDTLKQSVKVHQKPTIELGPDLKGTPGSSIQLKADVTVADKITWLPESGLSCYDCLNPVAYLTRTITYTAVASTPYCKASDDITIRVACDEALFFIPNTFTPNNDGANDRFYPIASGVSKVDLFRVYNRWGEKLFEARNFEPNKPELGWDGIYKGQPLTPDVYVYYLESKCANGEKIFLKGDISLIR